MNAVIDIARATDDEAMRQLARTQAMPGRVDIAFCREPRFSTGCEVTGDDARVVVARSAGGEVVGLACRSTRRVFVNGDERRIGYLGQLRVREDYRGRWLLSRGFARLREIERADPVGMYLASIVEGNDEATRLLVDRSRRSFPRFTEVARIVTLALPARGGRYRHAAMPSGATAEQLPEIVEFLRREGAGRQLCSAWTVDRVRRLAPLGLQPGDIRVARRGGSIAGVLALWDQSAYKQSRIRAYRGWLQLAAPLLPRPGTELRSAYAAFCSVAGDDAATFDMLLDDVRRLAASRGLAYLLLGLDSRDPLLAAARRRWHIAYRSRLYVASWPEGAASHAQLDSRPAYVDIATL